MENIISSYNQMNSLFFRNENTEIVSIEKRIFYLPIEYIFEANGNKYITRYPFLFQYQDNEYFLESVDLDIHISSPSLSKLIEELSDEIDFLWSFYILGDESVFDSSAIHLRNIIKSFITKVK